MKAITTWEEDMTTPPMMPSLEKIAAALGLPADASTDELVAAFTAFVQSADARARTGPARLAELVERICAKENVAFAEGLTRAKAREPALVEAVAQFYARGR